MRRTVPPLLVRLCLLAAALSLMTILSVTVATPLHSETGGYIEELSYSEPMAVERPVAGAKGFEDSERPNIRPEPAIAPEIRKLKLKISQQLKAEQQRAQQQAAARQEVARQEAARQEAKRAEAERREAQRQEAEREKAERQEAQRREAQRQKAKAEAEKAAQVAATRKIQSLPAEASERSQARPPAKSQPAARRPAPRGGKMALTIEDIGLRNSPIETSDEQQVLDRGLMHLPQTSQPWERDKARNVYVVGHRMGWPGTKSWKIFYRLDELKSGDQLVLTAGDETYRYKVTEKFVVTPWDVWVTDPVKGRDLLTLQTCTGPNFDQRLIIRADRV
ncbi:MAG: sortase [Rubrobacteraceae bacterium]